jgi:hypothetical protein
MRRLRKTCLVTLPLATSSFQFGRFIAAQSPQAARQRQDKSGTKAQAAEKKQPDYSQEAYVIEQIWRALVRPTVPGIDHFSGLSRYAICGKKRTDGG